MKATKHIISWLEEMVNKYPFLYFRYEYSERWRTHQICVYPKNEIGKCEAYCEEQMDWHEKMDELVPEETILFSDEEEFFSCSANALEIRHSSLLEKAN